MATAQKTQQQTQQRPKLFSLEEVTHHLTVARPTFDSVVAHDQLPLVWDSEFQFARDLVMKDDWLRRCLPQTLASVLQNIAHVGLTLNPIKHHCTIVARWNKDDKVFEASFLSMYRGLVYLATQAGVHDIVADVVYKADSFLLVRKSSGDEYEHGINIRVARGADGNPFQGAYVSAKMPNSSERKVEWVPAEDIYKMREQSDSYKDDQGNVRPNSPWVKWFDEQAKKSALKRASKRWEEAMDHGAKWQRFQQAVALDHLAEGRIIEGQAEEVEVEKLTVEQITDIETKAKELGHGDVNKYLRKVCAAYGTEVLADVDKKYYNEILERIAASKAEVEKRRAKGDKK
jgi:recombinational DNA repair protein RecT